MAGQDRDESAPAGADDSRDIPAEQSNEQSLFSEVSARVLPDRLRRSYSLKLGITLFLVVVAIGVAGYFVQASAAKTLENDVQEQLKTETEVEAEKLSEWLHSNRRTVLMISSHPAVANSSQRQSYIQRTLDEQLPERVKAIHVGEPVPGKGVVITASTNQSRIGEQAERKRRWGRLIGQTRERRVVFSEPVADPAGETVVVGMSTSPRQIGVLVAVVFDTSDFSDRLSTGINGTFTEVVRPAGNGTTVLFSNSPNGDRQLEPYIRGKQAREIPEIDQATTDASFLSRPTRQAELEKQYVTAYARVENSQWVVIKHAPVASAYSLRREIRQGILLFVLIALGGVALIGVTIGRNTAVSLRRLSKQAGMVKDGNYEETLHSPRVDEIGRLFEAVDEMRRSIVEQLREVQETKEQLRQQNENLDEFASIVAHDLRNPINVARLHIGLVKRETDSESVEKIEWSLDRMEKIIEDLLNLARAGQIVGETETVDLDEIANKSWENVRTEHADLTVVDTVQFQANPSYLEQIFENLFRNSVQHGIETRRSETDTTTPDLTIRVGSIPDGFFIADNGRGIPEEKRDEVFERGHTTHEDGTGLGLSIVKTVASSHGWDVQVTESTEGGARFEITGIEQEQMRVQDDGGEASNNAPT